MPEDAVARLEAWTEQIGAVAGDEPSGAPSWQQIGDAMRDVRPHILYGVAGARFNAWKPVAEPPAPAGACAHDLCLEGDKLDPSCDPCAQQIGAADAYCKDTAWDDLCVEQVTSRCGLTCS